MPDEDRLRDSAEADHGFVGEGYDGPALWLSTRRLWSLADRMPVLDLPPSELAFILDRNPDLTVGFSAGRRRDMTAG